MTSRRDMLRYLTKKLKSQSLNEVQPFQEKGDEDHDSGTESDDENQDFDDLDDDLNARGNSPADNRSLSDHIHGPLMHSLDSSATHEISEHNLDSISCTSDYERQSLDFDRHSSEEELETIHREVVAEKRKWSQVHSGSCDSSGSLDDEVKELMLEPHPVLFSSSPPNGMEVGCLNNNNCIRGCDNVEEIILAPELVHCRNKTVGHREKDSPLSTTRLFLAKVSMAETVSPRKRHRQTSTSDITDSSPSSKTVMRRPSLDFEKMQKNVVKKPCTHNIGRAKVVKIKTVTGGSPITAKCLSDPAIFSFRSISSVRYGQLTPVEQPPCAY